MREQVAVRACEAYEEEAIFACVAEMFAALRIEKTLFAGCRVALKPNLVMAKKPEAAATTHPAVIAAVAKLVLAWGAKEVVVVDSPGGPYTAVYLENVYRTCGLSTLSEIPGVRLNDDFRFQAVTLPAGRTLHNCTILQTILDCDILINLCKLKTHGLTGLSCATKNLFGVIPGVEKFSMHATFPKIEDFSDMLVDITEYIRAEKPYIALCDGILGMEGNGPTHGEPVSAGVLLAARNPYALDVVAAHIIGCDVPVVHLDKAQERGLVSTRDPQEIEVVGDPLPGYHFTPPEASAGRFLKNLSGICGGRLAEFFAAKPRIDGKKCIGCGVCVRSCPAHTITIRDKKAVIPGKACIRCYCCQELCPHGAVGMRKNPLIRLVH